MAGIPTVSITHCCAGAERGRWRWLALLLLCALVWSAPARADEATRGLSDAPTVALSRTAEGVFLAARLPLDLSPAVEDALRKGIALHFAWQADLVRPRWYWTDKTVGSAQRSSRLTFHPLTRRWRVSTSSGPASAAAAAYSLHQTFDTLAEAVSSLGRVLRWKVASADELASTGASRIDFSFQLDLGQLPRPFQIGVANQAEWEVVVQRSLRIPEAVTRSDEGPPAPSAPNPPAPAEDAR